MSSLSAASVETPAVTDGTEQKKPLKACCACPDTKKVRDAWCVARDTEMVPFFSVVKTISDGMFVSTSVIEKGEENCGALIEAHKECMRSLGFKV